jgi:uncharacterized integral membrane protein (TIGR00697 family)
MGLKPSASQPVSFKHLHIVSGFFVAIIIISNIASSAKIADMGFSIFGIRMAFDGGTLLFPLAYIIGDVITEVYGFRAARRVILTGFTALGLSALVFFILKILPSEHTWEARAGSHAYKAILGGISSGGIAAASLLAYLSGEFANSVILSKLKVLMKGRMFWVRAIGSSLVGEFLDSFIFILVASITGVFPAILFLNLVITNYLLKLIIEILVLPATYRIVNFLKRIENIDVFDIGVKYSPLP